MSRKCVRGGKVAAKNTGPRRIFFEGAWRFRCSCGAAVTASRVGWAGGRHGLIVDEHERGAQ